MDCWVAQLGVVTDQHEKVAAASTLRVSTTTGRVTLAADITLKQREISPFIIDMENNGQLSHSGLLRTQEGDLRDLVGHHMQVARTRWKLGATDKVDVAVYAHGGLTGEATALDTASRWIPALYDAQIFPIFFMWETDAVVDAQGPAGRCAARPAAADRRDQRRGLELLGRAPRAPVRRAGNAALERDEAERRADQRQSEQRRVQALRAQPDRRQLRSGQSAPAPDRTLGRVDRAQLPGRSPGCSGLGSREHALHGAGGAQRRLRPQRACRTSRARRSRATTSITSPKRPSARTRPASPCSAIRARSCTWCRARSKAAGRYRSSAWRSTWARCPAPVRCAFSKRRRATPRLPPTAASTTTTPRARRSSG